MARRIPNNEEDVSLFPFLSILACVIGVLTLLISALALAQMDTDTMALAEEFERVQQEVVEGRQRASELADELNRRQQQLDDQQGQQQQELAEARRRLEEVRQRLAALEEPPKTQPPVDVPPVDAEAHKQRIEELQAELERLQERIAQLEKEIAERKLPPEESEVTILPAGSGANFHPHFVECAAGAVVLHTTEKPQTIPIGEAATHEAFQELLAQVAKTRRGTIVFLIRDDGLSTYHRARRLVEDADIHHGKLPVIGKGRLDLTQFQENKSS